MKTEERALFVHALECREGTCRPLFADPRCERLVRHVADEIRDAVEEEREACAFAAAHAANDPQRRQEYVAFGAMAVPMVVRDIVDAIRARGKA